MKTVREPILKAKTGNTIVALSEITTIGLENRGCRAFPSFHFCIIINWKCHFVPGMLRWNLCICLSSKLFYGIPLIFESEDVKKVKTRYPKLLD